MQCSFSAPLKTTVEHSANLHLQPDTGSTPKSTSSLEGSPNEHSTENQSFSCFKPPFLDPNLLFGVQIQEITTPIDQELNLVPSQKYPLTPLEMLDRLPSYSSSASCNSREITYSEIAEAEEVEIGITSVRHLIEMAPEIIPAEKELLLHFEEFTSQNLALSTKIWGTSVLRCALEVGVPFPHMMCLLTVAVRLPQKRHPSHYRSTPGSPLITLSFRSQNRSSTFLQRSFRPAKCLDFRNDAQKLRVHC